MELKGSPEFDKLWNYLKNESTRGRVVAVAARFDERLGELLGQPNMPFASKIKIALSAGLITPNEHHDLNAIRNLRNVFAHELSASEFDAESTTTVNSLRTWQIGVDHLPAYADLLKTAGDRLLYVAAAIESRLNRRGGPSPGPLPEPDFMDPDSWPPVTSI